MSASRVAEMLARIPGVMLLRADTAAGYAVDGRRPSLVARPRDSDGVAAVLRLASYERLAVVPRGGGTALALGNIPTALDLVLDLSGLTRVLEYRPRDLTVTAEAGVTIAALQQTLDQHDQMIALDPPLPGIATVGGALATNLSGPRSHRYGTARDIVIGASAMLADGSEIKSGGRVVKNVAGYDMSKLLIGSAGTLAVITQATFKLLPAPPVRGMVIAGFDGMEGAHRAAQAAAAGTLGPLSLDLVNPAAARAAAAPETDTPDRWLLIAELGGTAAAVDRGRAELMAVARDAGCRHVTSVGTAAHERRRARLRDIGHLVDAAPPVVLRAAVLPSQAATACRLIEEAARAAGVDVGLVARAGVVRSYWPDAVSAAVPQLVSALRGRLASLAGMLTVERCPPEAKRGLEVWGIDGPDVDLMRRIKGQLDPGAVLSPGRGPAGL